MSHLLKLREKLSFRRRALLLTLLVIIVLGGVTGVVYRDRIGPLTRLFHAGDTSTADGFAHKVQANDLFIGIGNRLLICSSSGFQLLSPTGKEFLSETVSMADPAVADNGAKVVVYDAGGRELRVLDATRLAFSLTLPVGQTILSATINNSGWLAVTSKVDGYKGVVTVYDSSFEPVVAIRLSSRYLSDAMVTPDCKSVFAVSPEENNGTFESTVQVYNLSNCDEPSSEVSLGDNVVLGIRATENLGWILGDTGLSILRASGTASGQYDYNGNYLKRASLNGSGFAALLLSNSQAGSSGTLMTVANDGTLLGKVDLSEPVLALTANGHYVAVLTSSHLYLYDKSLSQRAVSDNSLGVRNIALYADGSLGLITDELVIPFVPN